ncbi:MAG: hypothetical protein WCP21_06040 [Armatimonadota bacterium]
MNPHALRPLVLPVVFLLGVAASVALFVMVTSKGVVLALAFGIFVSALIYSMTSAGAALWCLIFAAYFEALYKSAAASMLTMLVKDFFLVIAVLRLVYVSQRQRDYRWLAQPFTTAAVIFVIYCLALMFAPATRSILLAVAGLRGWVLWMPVYFPAYAHFTSKEVVTKFLVTLMLVQLPVQVYGIVQGNIGYEHTKIIPGFYEITKWYSVDVDVNQGHHQNNSEASDSGIDQGFKPIMNVRACSITISPGTLGSMSCLTILLALGVLGFTSSPAIRLWSLATALASAGGLMASGSRAPMVGLAAGVLAMLVVSRHRTAVISGLIVVLLGGVFVLKDMSGGGAIRLGKKLTFAGAIERAMYPMAVGWEQGFSHPFGNGIASGAGIGRMFYGARLQTAEGTRFIENEFGRAMSELGVVGAAIWVGMLVSLLWRCFTAIRAMGTRPEAALSAGVFAVMSSIFVQLTVGSALYSAQPGIYFWIFGAAIIRLGQFARAEPSEAAPLAQKPRLRRFGRVWVPAEDYPQRQPAAFPRRVPGVPVPAAPTTRGPA